MNPATPMLIWLMMVLGFFIAVGTCDIVRGLKDTLRHHKWTKAEKIQKERERAEREKLKAEQKIAEDFAQYLDLEEFLYYGSIGVADIALAWRRLNPPISLIKPIKEEEPEPEPEVPEKLLMDQAARIQELEDIVAEKERREKKLTDVINSQHERGKRDRAKLEQLQLTPMDRQLLCMLRDSTVEGTITLPSGKVMTANEFRNYQEETQLQERYS